MSERTTDKQNTSTIRQSLKALRAVAWGFFGVRRRSGHENDIKLGPVAVILAGLIAAACFIGVLIFVVSMVV